MRAIVGLVLALVVAACGGSSSATTTEATTSGSPSDGSVTTVAAATSDPLGGATNEPPGDVPPACTLATAAEVSGLLGTEVTAGETIGGECSYEPADGLSLFLTAGAFPLSAAECATWLPSEALFEGEVVEPAPEFGDDAAIITAESRTDYFVCASGAAVTVEMIGPESMTAEEQKAAAAGVMNLILDRL